MQIPAIKLFNDPMISYFDRLEAEQAGGKTRRVKEE